MADPIRVELPSDSTTRTPPPNAEGTKPDGTPPQRPDDVPEKFWKDGKLDHAALLKSYTELERQASGKGKDGTKPEGEQAKPGETPKPEETLASDEALKPFYEEFAKDGKLSEASYEKLAKEHKLPRAIVEQYIASTAAKAQADEAAVYESIGGREVYDDMAEWARTNLNAQEIAAYNTALANPDQNAVKLAVAGLYQKFSTAEGRPQARIRGEGRGGNVTPFKSTAEVTAAMSDPRYATDPAYRKEVADRMSLSNVF